MGAQDSECLPLARTSSLLDGNRQPVELRLDLIQWQEPGARRQDGRFDDGEHRSIETEEVAQPADVQHLDLESRALTLLLAGADTKLGIAAGIAQNLPTDVCSRKK